MRGFNSVMDTISCCNLWVDCNIVDYYLLNQVVICLFTLYYGYIDVLRVIITTYFFLFFFLASGLFLYCSFRFS